MSADQKMERLIGRIEGTINGMKENMERIEKQNGDILKAVQDQKLICATTRQKFENQIDLNDDRIQSLEESGVPTKTKKQINVNSIVATINLVFTIIKSWMGLP